MEARSRGLTTTAVVAGIALAVAVLAVWVWPSAPSGAGGAEPEPGAVDVAGPVGRIGHISTGPNAGGLTDEPEELPGVGVYDGSTGTGGLTAPIGGFEPVRGVTSDPLATSRAALGAARATPTIARGR
jgi:hypothetical protein